MSSKCMLVLLQQVPRSGVASYAWKSAIPWPLSVVMFDSVKILMAFLSITPENRGSSQVTSIFQSCNSRSAKKKKQSKQHRLCGMTNDPDDVGGKRTSLFPAGALLFSARHCLGKEKKETIVSWINHFVSKATALNSTSLLSLSSDACRVRISQRGPLFLRIIKATSAARTLSRARNITAQKGFGICQLCLSWLNRDSYDETN